MNYQDFTLDIRSAEGEEDRFEATVVDAPFRQNPRIFFPPPLNETELADLLKARDQREKMPKGLSSREVGGRLYTALFQGEVDLLFERSRAVLAPDATAGLRVRLKFLLNDPKARYLAALPWEWLWDPRNKSFLATDLKTPVIRDFATRHLQLDTLETASPLRILVVDPAPKDLHGVSAGEEIARMEEALRKLLDSRQVEIVRLQETTAEELHRVVRTQGIHIVHFMGHGGYDESSGLGAVFFTKPDGTKDTVDGQELADSVKTISQLRLVILNSCLTARHAGHAGAPNHYGVASAVLEWAGVPAVIANQHEISNTIAPCISRIFYEWLAAGDDVEAALTEARREIETHSSEWATPVLFLAARSGKIFSLKKPGTGGQGVRVLRPSEHEEEPVRLGVRSIHGFGAEMEDRNEHLLDLTPYFNGRFIRDPKDWQRRIFPELRAFLKRHLDPYRPLVLDFAAHSSIAFAAGWVLEAKSGRDIRVVQRVGGTGTLLWAPDDGTAGEDRLWLDRPDIEIPPVGPKRPDVAAALSVSQPGVAEHVEAFLQARNLPVGRIIDATIAPEPGQGSVRGGAHSLRLAQALYPRIRERYPHERSGGLHLFCAAPNALLVYLGQLSRALGAITLYEFAFGVPDNFGRYQRSIELPPPDERPVIPEGW